MSSTLEYGEISAIDYRTCRVRVRLDERDGVESYWLNVPQRHSQANQSRPLLPELGEQGAVLLSADGVGGVWLGGVYSSAEPPPVVDPDTDYVRFSDGTLLTYDRAAHLLTLDCVGAVTLKCAQSLRIEAGAPVLVKAPSVTLDASQTTLNGNLQINGNLNASGTVMDAGGNSNHHKH
ncbi:phage baseplate assembly protein V [Pseudomonas sp. 5P_3.1_Bac2]|uniref:phage baseplate assembly protein V n=1 Tax=Pseudomonas sp. 5P_3.1_Bac2 TaxID=2971617 RepID=UPI0021C5BB26|nr:phage baseplate assembly protein V [Pseudomonas sp. 5P_3.1_Bac2]MCU1718675.1 phage baseplate assembly protein V [Pseudomonas sp. 5P_3.1_Bac2]